MTETRTATVQSLNIQIRIRSSHLATWVRCFGEDATSATVRAEIQGYKDELHTRALVEDAAKSAARPAESFTVESIYTYRDATNRPHAAVQRAQRHTYDEAHAVMVAHASKSDPRFLNLVGMRMLDVMGEIALQWSQLGASA